MGESPSVFREYFHTGRLHTRIDYSIFKKSNAMKKKKKTLSYKKIQYLKKVKHDKYENTHLQRGFQKKIAVLKTDQNP